MAGPIREWARSQGLKVGDRGLIPREIIEAYKQAHDIGTHPAASPPANLRFPPMPPKPRIIYGGDCWIVDTGYADVLHDTWPEAVDHASRICHDYRARLTQWLTVTPDHTNRSEA